MNFLRKKVLRQIERSYEWLEQAEEAYREGGLEDGERKLSLANAELRLAWEISCLRRSAENNLKAIKSSTKNINYAAAMALFIVFSFSLALALGPLLCNSVKFVPFCQGVEKTIMSDDSLSVDRTDSPVSALEFEMLKLARKGLEPVEKEEIGSFWSEIQLVGSQVKKIDYLYGQTQWVPLDKGGR